MSRAAPHDAPPMPNWPALMTTELACAYTSLARASFLLLAGRQGVLPVECAGLAVVRWKRTDLDVLIDKLPARGAEMDIGVTTPSRESPAQSAAPFDG